MDEQTKAQAVRQALKGFSCRVCVHWKYNAERNARLCYLRPQEGRIPQMRPDSLCDMFRYDTSRTPRYWEFS